MKYPKLVRSGHSQTTLFSIDIVPTVAELVGFQPEPSQIDGKSFAGLLRNPEGWQNRQPYYALTNGREFQAVISGDGRYKLHAPHQYRTLAEPGGDGQAGKYRQDSTAAELYDLIADPFERNDLSDQLPEKLAEMKDLYDRHRAKFFDH